MKRYLKNFCSRGLVAAAFGPIVLAVVYLILYFCGVSLVISTEKICREILTVELLAFFAGGFPILYSVERIPTLLAALLHAAILYLDYAVIYLVNAWIPLDIRHFIVFTLCFFLGFALIWLAIWFFTRRSASDLNHTLAARRSETDI